METAKERIECWAKTGEELSFPQWEELPSIPLYMDQVILYLGEVLRFFQQGEENALLTSSMINNYVKNGVLPHPEKKKYGREHLAALIAVCALKQILSLQDIRALLEGEGISKEQYDLFLHAHGQAVQETCRALGESCRSDQNLREEALRLAAQANAKQTAARKILEELEEDKPKKEHREKKG